MHNIILYGLYYGTVEKEEAEPNSRNGMCNLKKEKKFVINIQSVFKNYFKMYHPIRLEIRFVLAIYNNVSTQYDDLGKKNLIESNIIIVEQSTFIVAAL